MAEEVSGDGYARERCECGAPIKRCSLCQRSMVHMAYAEEPLPMAEPEFSWVHVCAQCDFMAMWPCALNDPALMAVVRERVGGG